MGDGGGGGGRVALVTSICYELDGELEHEAIWVLFGQLVEEVPPRGEADHVFQPWWHLGLKGWQEKWLVAL